MSSHQATFGVLGKALKSVSTDGLPQTVNAKWRGPRCTAASFTQGLEDQRLRTLPTVLTCGPPQRERNTYRWRVRHFATSADWLMPAVAAFFFSRA